MGKMQKRLFLLVVGLTAAILVSPCPAADPPEEPPGSTPVAAAAEDYPLCSCACSPWAGAWVASFEPEEDEIDNHADKEIERFIQTFKFLPVNFKCDQFAVNSHGNLCPPKLLKAFPKADAVTEFVGKACKAEPDKLDFTAIGYGVKKRVLCDEVVFIAVMSGTVIIPCGCAEPAEATIIAFVSYFAAEQDEDGDGFPEPGCEAVLCVCHTGKLKRVQLTPPCEPAESFVADLEACEDCRTEAKGRAFFKLTDYDRKLSFVVTVKDIEDVQRTAIVVSDTPDEIGEPAAILCPIPPETQCKSGPFSGLLCCGTVAEKDLIGPLKDKRLADLIKAIIEGRAFVVVYTRQNPHGELCGKIEDP